jgi:hypothetical protein
MSRILSASFIAYPGVQWPIALRECSSLLAPRCEGAAPGMQAAFWRLGGVPIEHRTDNLSAATHELAESRGRKFTERYRELTDHHGLRASRTSPVTRMRTAMSSRRTVRLKNAIDQRLRLRGSRAFASREAYESFLDGCVQTRNATSLTLSSEPHVRWCGRTAGVSPPPTRSVSVAAGKLRVTRRRGT